MNNIEPESTKSFTDDELLNSPTIKKLSILSRVNPVNVNNPSEVKEALAPALVYLVDAIDNDKIQCQDKADRDALFQMMFICHQLITQPRPTSATRH
jgi:hypothetical protein